MITFNDGSKIAGFLGPNSFVSSFPNDEDIYIEEVWTLDDQGKIKEIVKETKGVLIRHENIKIIEFFEYKEYD